jgi:hypothetical protein
LAVGLLFCCATAAFGEPAAPLSGNGIAVSAAVLHRRLVERTDDGSRLVTESGELLRLQVRAERTLAGGGAVEGAASAAAGTLDYDGHTQGGAPLATRSRHRDLGLQAGWRPLAPASWGELWLSLQALQQRRDIASTSQAQGLRETSMLLLPGLRWRHAFEAAGWRWQPALELRASARHRLEVDSGGLFDTADLEGGRRRELGLALDAAPLGSAWSFGLAWSHARQSASPVQTLSQGGVPVGTVRQPRITIDDVSLRATRSF